MGSVAIALPALPGGVAVLNATAAELNGPRRAELEDFNTRYNLDQHNTYLQSSPAADLVIIYLAGPDLVASFTAAVTTTHPFDIWLFDQAVLIHGLDFRQPMPGPLPTTAFESGP